MSEKPLAAVRKKPKSSIVVGLAPPEATGTSDAFVSAGNTGAMLAGLHRAARPARRRRARHRGHAVSHRRRARPGARRRRQPRLLRPRAGRLRLPRHRLHARRPGPRQPGRRACSTWARRRRRAPRSSARPTSCSSRSPRLNYAGNIEGRDILPGPQQPDPGGRGRLRRLRGQHRAQVLRVVGAGLRRPAARSGLPTSSSGPRCAEPSTGSSTTPTYGGAPLLGVQGRLRSSATAPPAPTPSRTRIRVAVQAVALGPERAHRGRVRPARAAAPRHDPPPVRGGRQRRRGACPPGVLTNADLTRMLDTSDEWIVERTGIRERHIARPEQTVADAEPRGQPRSRWSAPGSPPPSSTPSCSPPRAPTGCCPPPPATSRPCSAPTTPRRSTSARPAPGSSTRSPWPRG